MKTDAIKLLVLALVAGGSLTAKAEPDVMTKTFPVKPGGKLVLNVDRGSVHITTSSSEQVEIKISRELKRGSVAEAKRIFEQHKIEMTSSDNEVKIEAQNPQKLFGGNSAFNRLQVDYIIAIPSKF